MGTTTDKRRRRSDLLPVSERVLSVWGLTPDGRVQVGRIQPPRSEYDTEIVVGCRVCIVTPDIPQMHNTYGVVLAIEPWGCHLEAPAAASGRFRALWSEMVLA